MMIEPAFAIHNGGASSLNPIQGRKPLWERRDTRIENLAYAQLTPARCEHANCRRLGAHRPLWIALAWSPRWGSGSLRDSLAKEGISIPLPTGN
jgi:hypothetical protein